MNEAERLKEKKENDERTKVRKKELVARPEPNEKVYEITLKLTDEPGLPPPVSKTNHVVSADDGGRTNAAPIKIKAVAVEENARTNHASSLAKNDANPAGTDDEADEFADDKLPALDIPLEEAKRILIDFISLSTKQSGLAVTAEK